MKFDLKRVRELLMRAEASSRIFITIPNLSDSDHFLLRILEDAGFVWYSLFDHEGKYRIKSAGLDFLQKISDPEIFDALLKKGNVRSIQQVRDFLERGF